MINPEEIEPNREFELKIRGAFQARDPDQQFIDSLQKKLENRFTDRERSTQSRPTWWQEKIQLILTPLAWGTAGVILLLTLVWGIKTLIPRSEPVINSKVTPSPATSSQATTSPVVTQAQQIEPTQADVVPVPMGGLAINPVNAAQVTQLSSWGRELISAVAWAPDGKTFAVQAGGNITFYHRETIKEIGKFASDSDAQLAYSPDGSMLATGSNNGSVKIWDVASGKEIKTLTGHKNFINRVAFSPNGEILASAAYQELPILWDVSNGQELRKLSIVANNLVFSPDGTILATSGGDDRTVRLWDVASGQELHKITGHSDYVYGLAFSPDGKWLASTSNDKTIKLWDVVTGNELQTLTDQVISLSIAFLPDGVRLITVGESEPIKVWDIASAQVQRTVGEGIEGGNFSLSPDGTKVLHYSWGGDAIRLLDITTGAYLGAEELGRLDWKTYMVTSLAISPDGRILAVGLNYGGIKLLDAATGQEVRSLSGHTNYTGLTPKVNSLDFSPDGKLLASTSPDDTTRVWDVTSGNELDTIHGVAEIGWEGGQPTVAFSPDGKLLAIAGPKGQVKVWDVINHVELRKLGGVTDGSYADILCGLAFSPDGEIIASGYASGSVTLWDAASGQELRTMKYNTGEWLMGVSELEFSPDGKFLAVGMHNAELVIRDISNGNVVYKLALPWHELISDLDFSPDGNVLAVGGGFDSLVLLEAASGKDLINLNRPANGVVFSPDGKRLITGDYEGGIKLWGLPEEYVSPPEATAVPSEAVLATPEVRLPTPDDLNIEKTPIPILLSGNKIDPGEWSPEGSYFFYSQQGAIGESGPDQVTVTVSFLDAHTGETCEGIQEIVKLVDNPWVGMVPEGVPLSKRTSWLGDNRLLYLSLSGELMAIKPCSESIENWTAALPDVTTALPGSTKADGSQILLQGKQAYWLFTPSTQQSVKLDLPLSEEGMETRIGWIPGEEKLYASWIEDRGELWIVIAMVDTITGATSPFYEAQASKELYNWELKFALVEWLDKDLVLVYDTITGDSLVDLSNQPVKSTTLYPDLFGFEKPSRELISSWGATHEATRQDYHLILATGMMPDGKFYIYHPESGQVDQYTLDTPLLVVYPNGDGGIAAFSENPPSFGILRVILVDRNSEPYDLAVKGHDSVSDSWSFATILPGAKQVLFSSNDGISVVDLQSGVIESFWGYENQEKYTDIYSSISPDKKTVVSWALAIDNPGEALSSMAMYWLRLEP